MPDRLKQAREVLAFDEALGAVAACAASELGRRAVRALAPSPWFERCRAAIRLAHEWMGLLARQIEPPMAGIFDITQALNDAAVPGALIEPERLFEIGAFAGACERLKAHLTSHAADGPELARLAATLAPAPQTRREIETSIGPKGEVLDAASPELRHIRRERASLDARLTGRLQSMVSQLNKDGVLAEDFYTQRNGRYVLPVKVAARNRVPGIVHDASNTGQTLFIEPLAIIELSNDLTALRLREEEEIRRILIALCDAVRAELPALQANLAIMAELDSIHARARFGHKYACALPRLGDGAPLDLRRAHHPLLYLTRRDASIPITLTMEEGDRALVISGPNAGGKTTALKTIGLLCMMAQTAIPVPADPASTFPVFSKFFADIGDEQDVEAGRSTFSAHIEAIRLILEQTDERSLVLLDELGTATDPTEGGCLGVAIVERLCDRAALTVLTSHLATLKNWAHEEPRARNSSFHLDEDTHRPSFVLTMDVPGASEALVVAEQQGLDPALIRRARELLPAGQDDVSSLIISLQRKNEDLAAMKREEAELLEKLEADRERYESLYAQYQAERKAFKKDLLAEKKRLLDGARAEIERRIAHLPSREASWSGDAAATGAAAPALPLKDALRKAQRELRLEQQQAARELADLEEPPALPEDMAALKPGDAVRVEGMSDPARVMAIEMGRGRARVQVRGVTMELPLTRLRPAGAQEIYALQDAEKRRQARGVRVVKRPESAISLELDLHGMYVEEAIDKTDRYLSDAAVHDAKFVRVMHGTGTGRLRRGIHDFLKTHPLVKHFRYGLPDEGGAGVTIVELRE